MCRCNRWPHRQTWLQRHLSSRPSSLCSPAASKIRNKISDGSSMLLLAESESSNLQELLH